jgi:hypothetical protein
MRVNSGWAVLSLCILTGIIGAALQNTSANIDLDTSEQALKVDHTVLLDLRKRWMTEIFRYHDDSAMNHVFFPLLFTALSNSATVGLLVAYLYESLLCVTDMYWESRYFTRITDSLVQDPVLGAVGVAYIMIVWSGSHLHNIAELARKNLALCALVLVGTWYRNMDLGIDISATHALVSFPVSVLFVGCIAYGLDMKVLKESNRKTVVTLLFILLTAWVPLMAAQVGSYKAMQHQWVDPFQSTAWWAVSLLALMAVINPRKWWDGCGANGMHAENILLSSDPTAVTPC